MGYPKSMAKLKTTIKRHHKTKRTTRTRYKNIPFLKALGQHCKRLRIQRGYSIDRLAKESDQLSPASIDRLEKGTADSQTLVLVRYAETLGLSLLDLFAFLRNSPELVKDSRIIPYEENIKPPSGFVPVYPLKVAAGKFANDEDSASIQPLGWIDANLKSSSPDFFACFIHGESMEPLIKDGSLCLFRRYSGGSRQGKVFLIQARGLKDNETGESYVIKKYQRQTPTRSSDQDEPAIIHLISENSKFSPIVLVGLSDEEVQTIAEFIKIL